jgi:hypothetical protein
MEQTSSLIKQSEADKLSITTITGAENLHSKQSGADKLLYQTSTEPPRLLKCRGDNAYCLSAEVI